MHIIPPCAALAHKNNALPSGNRRLRDALIKMTDEKGEGLLPEDGFLPTV